MKTSNSRHARRRGEERRKSPVLKHPSRPARPAFWWARWAAAGLVPALHGAEIDSTYAGPGGGSWNTAGNWNPATAFPNNGGGDTYNALFPNNVSVNLGQDLTIQRLTVSSGVTLNGAFNLDLENGFDFAGNIAKTLVGSTLNLNGGTATWSGTGGLALNNGATLNNFAILDIQNNATVFTGAVGGSFHNHAGATLRKSAGGGTTSFNASVAFINDGTIDIDSGTLDLTGATLNHGTQFTGTGATRAVSGTYNLSGTLTANNNFTLAGGTVSGTHTLSGGTWNWAGGTLGGAVGQITTLPSGATLALSGAAAKTLSVRTLETAVGGAVTLSGASLQMGNAAVVNNGGTFEFLDDSDLINAGGGGTFNNLAGATLRKSGGTDVSSFNPSITFVNDGIIDVDSGTLSFSAGATLNDGTQFTGTGLTRATIGTYILNGTITADDNFEIANGTVTGTHTLSGGLWRWTGGTWGGGSDETTTVPSGVTLGASGASSKTLSARTLAIAAGGTMTLQGGNFQMGNAAILNNAGTFDFQDDADVINGGGSGTFNNLAGGILRKSGGAGTSSFNSGIQFLNSGSIDVDSGVLDLNNGGTLNSGTEFTGTALTRAVSGAFTLNGNLTADDNFEIAGGTILGTHTLSGGLWRWSGGTWGGVAADETTIPAGVTLEVSGVSAKTLSARTLETAAGGLVSWEGGSLQMLNGAVLNNAGTFQIEDDADVINGGGGGKFNNLAGGILRKAGGAEATTFGATIEFVNDGTIDVDSGTLQLSGGATLNSGTEFTGTGLTRAVVGTFTLTGTLTANNNFELAGGTVGGTHTLGGGVWQWTGGILGGTADQATTLASGSTLAVSGLPAKNLSVRTLGVGQGASTLWSGGSLQFVSGAKVNNAGLFEVQDDADLINGGGGGGLFNNQAGGTFRKSGGGGTTAVGTSVAFSNSGVVEVESGTLSFALGTYTHAGGTLRVENGATISFGSAVTMAAGLVQGVGSITTAKLTANGVTIAPGLSSGVLSLSGELEMNSASQLIFELGGLTPGNGPGHHDQLVVGGKATFAGLLEVRFLGGFQNTLDGSETFTLLDAGSPLVGSFLNVLNGERLTTADGLGSFLVRYGSGVDSDRLLLSEFQPVPEPVHGAGVVACGLLAWLGWRRVRP